ncbi:MAG: hypothetical protein HC820_01415 [Hydrococcus sp. RM1_1_31]|nr:hypothetical protein [Hydrococcus sp. RM1_1_31]
MNKKHPEILHWMEPVKQLAKRLSQQDEFLHQLALEGFTEEQIALLKEIGVEVIYEYQEPITVRRADGSVTAWIV